VAYFKVTRGIRLEELRKVTEYFSYSSGNLVPPEFNVNTSSFWVNFSITWVDIAPG
jgi:hypothetical protein